MKAKKVFLTAAILGIATFLMGVTRYYLSPDEDVFMGNYLMSGGLIIVGVLAIIIITTETLKIIKKSSKTQEELGLLVLSPLAMAYFIAMTILMVMNMVEIPAQGDYSVLDDVRYSLDMFKSEGYWTSAIIVGSLILLLIVFKKPMEKTGEVSS